MEAILLQHLISTSPAELLISSVWQGMVLTALAWAALKLAPGLRASTRFTLWLTIFLLVALLPGFALSHDALSQVLFGFHPTALPVANKAVFSLHLSRAWAFALEGAWVLASLLSFGRLASSLIQMRRLLKNSFCADLDPEIQALVSRAGKRTVELRLSDAVDAPSVVGFFRPAVVVPRSLWSELSPDDRKQIILHEMAHLERGDDWTNLLQKLLRALYPLNPALLWAERHLCREREQACDDAVLDAAVSARAYATCLTKLAESRLVRRVTALAPGLLQRRSELAGRVDNILHRRRGVGPWLSRALVAAGLVFSLSGVMMLQRFPGLVTFTSNAPVVATAAIPTEFAGSNQAAQFHQAVFHPDMSATGERASLLPKPQAKRQIRTFRHLQFVQVTQDPDSGGITLILYTVEVPQTSRASHGVSRPIISTTDNWIAFQI